MSRWTLYFSPLGCWSALSLLVLCGGEPQGYAESPVPVVERKSDTVAAQDEAAARGYRFLTTVPVLPPDFDAATLDSLPQKWPAPLRDIAKNLSPAARRQMAFDRYGLTRRPEEIAAQAVLKADEPPLQYVHTQGGQFVMNCFSCHGGTVLGKPYPGAPNNRFALQTLSEDIRDIKLDTGARLERMDLASLAFPLGDTNGTTNAVMFGVALMHYRDVDLNVHDDRLPPKLIHHDMDAPPWWHFHKKTHLYADAFVPKSPRSLMQFMLVRENGPLFFTRHESDFEDVYAYLDSLRPPAYPFRVDESLASRGKSVFSHRCTECHGTYDADETREMYPGRIVPIETIGTDPVRLGALTPYQRRAYSASWFGQYGKDQVVADPGGYVAPPLDGIWASAPYFHNGSVPTIWHLLHPSERPTVWRRTDIVAGENGADSPTQGELEAAQYDQSRVGLPIEIFNGMPTTIKRGSEKRTYFDTRPRGKSAAGHDFVDELSETEKQAVLEYLKTLVRKIFGILTHQRADEYDTKLGLEVRNSSFEIGL